MPTRRLADVTRSYVVGMMKGAEKVNGFLLTVGTRLDDLPIAIFATREEAVELSKLCEHDDCIFHRTALEQTGRDYAEPVCVSVSEFRDGLMVSHDVLRIFDEEEAVDNGDEQ